MPISSMVLAARTFLGVPPTLFPGARSNDARPGRKNAPREREWLFDIVRRSGIAVAAHFGETNPTNPTRVVPAKAGTHNHGLLVMGPGSPPASRASAGTTIFRKNEKSTCGCRKRSPAPIHCFGVVIYNENCNPKVSSRQRVATASGCRRVRSPPPTCRCRRRDGLSTPRACWPWLRSQARRSAASPPASPRFRESPCSTAR
jgi:hypothetical protein